MILMPDTMTGLSGAGISWFMMSLWDHPSLLSGEWRRLAGIKKRGEFDAIVARLQMQGYVITIDFEYAPNRYGIPCGWGIARYATPEAQFGTAFSGHIYDREPQESKERIQKPASAITFGGRKPD